MRKLGIDVRLYPLLRERAAVRHPEVAELLSVTRYLPFMSIEIIRANALFVVRSPRRYFGALFEAMAGTIGSINFLVGLFGIFPKSVGMAYEMEKAGVKHVHAHFVTHPGLAALIVHRLTGIPFSMTGHGSDVHIDQRMLKRKVEASAFTVVISEYNKRFIMDRLGADLGPKLHVVHCGVDVSQFQAHPTQRSGDRFRILCVAAHRDVKGHRHLIDALHILRRDGIDFICDLVGDGPLRAQLKAQVQALQLDRHVVFHGARTRPDVVRMMQDTHLVALTSVMGRRGNREGIPVTLIEAMACARPVVASRLSGIPELIDDGVSGILCEPANPKSIANAIGRVHRDPHLAASLGREGRKRVVEAFDLAQSVKAIAFLINGERPGAS